jgi:hypothetical protein
MVVSDGAADRFIDRSIALTNGWDTFKFLLAGA